MESIYVIEASYREDYKVFLEFNTGESGDADLRELIYTHDAAKPLRDKEAFSRFYLDSWPTLAWKCGFDVAPESLYYMVTGKREKELTG